MARMTKSNETILGALIKIKEATAKVPDGLRWSVEVTEDTSTQNPATLYIYVDDAPARERVRKRFEFGKPIDEYDCEEWHKYARILNVVITER